MTKILDGIRVLDLSRVFAGPAATQVLGDLGADVIKVEPPGGDEARYYGVTQEELAELGVSPSFIALNRNKRSIEIDMRRPEGKALARRLALKSDVIINNFRPGVMDRLGLDYDSLIAENPRLIYADFSAYGREGKLSGVGANDLALQAYSGLISITGEPGRKPVRCGTAIVDLHGSLALVSGILAALFHRERTGRGQRVESSLLHSAAHLMSYFYTEYLMTGTERAPMGTANHLSVPNQAFPAADGDVVIIASTNEMWRRLAHALDPEALDRPIFAEVFDRRRNRTALIEAVSDVTSKLTCAEIVDRLSKVKVVVAKVNSVGEAAMSEQLAAAGGYVELEQNGRSIKSVSAPMIMSEIETPEAAPAPALNADAGDILTSLGFEIEEIVNLTETGVIGKTTGKVA
ncbi:MAG: CoA transferase [Martelella sp.]|uniref:CaiB/BaiF CoA transferase family protein n=1 Tax=Martelella sp. TaxID=1969699 RepID=UPI003242A177